MNRLRLACVAALPLVALASCGGGGGGSSPAPPSLLSAGSDRTVNAAVPVTLLASAPASSGVADFDWSQTSGPAVELDGQGPAALVFVAPNRSTTLEFEVSGTRADGSLVGKDRVIVQVVAARPELRAPLLSTIDVRGGGQDRAIGSALHQASRRLFVVDGVAGDVVCYDVSNPSSPTFAGTVQAPAGSPGYVPGEPLAVACGESGAVAITWSGETLEFPGRLQFVDPFTLAVLREVSTTGSNPVDIDVTDDGLVFAVACAGDPPFVGGGDGRGYVTIVRVPPGGPGAIEVHADVSPIVFFIADGTENELEQEGVRFFAGTPTASVELTPRAVALSEDGTRAWAACPDNDALVTIDVPTALVVDVQGLGDREFDSLDGGAVAEAERWSWDTSEPTVVTPAGDGVGLGGITGIAAVAALPGGEVSMSVVTGAGPTVGGASSDRNGDGIPDLTFLDPGWRQAVRRVALSRTGLALASLGDVLLERGDGSPINGLPGLYAADPGLGLHDEQAVDLDGNRLAGSILGARFGGATTTPGGDLWMADARRAGVWRFDASGVLVGRFVPDGTPISFGSAMLPTVYGSRRANLELPPGRRFGGFGAIAYHPVRNSVFVATRLPLDNPDSAEETVSLGSRICRLLELAAPSGAVVGEYVFVLDGTGNAIEGMAFGEGPLFGGALALLECAEDPAGSRGVVRLDLATATNLLSLSTGDYAAVSAALESTQPDGLAGLAVPIIPIQTSRRVDLTEAGLGGGRPSALAFLGGQVVVGFDNGFGLAGASISATGGRVIGAAGDAGSAAFVSLSAPGIDASTDGGGHRPSELPIVGLSQPLDALSFLDGASDRLVLANGGLARVLENPSGNVFDERRRVGDLNLDTNVFPGSSLLQSSAVAGELYVSTLLSDANGDGLVDRLQAFGARSISLHAASGAQLWTSSGELAELAAQERPDRVDAGSTGFGIRPSSLALGTLDGPSGGGRVLVAGLREAGLVALYDLQNPAAPLLAGSTSRAADPVDVDLARFGSTILAVTDRAMGRIELRRVTRD